MPIPHADPFLKHYFRIAKLYCGSGANQRVDACGVKATIKLRSIFANEPKPGLIEVLAFTGKRWESGFSLFEERVAAVGATYREHCLFATQAA